MNKIKNIIFDLGGVILNINYNLTKEAFRKIGVRDFDRVYSQAQQQLVFDYFETGMLSCFEFRRQLKDLLNLEVNDNEIDWAWNKMLLDLPSERIDLLNKLRKKYRLFLLSNTNEIHINSYSNYLEATYGLENLSHIFEKEYYSYRIGLRKPDEDIFNYVLNENNLNADETFFIDDSAQHITGAQKTGINTHHLIPPQSIIDFFKPWH